MSNNKQQQDKPANLVADGKVVASTPVSPYGDCEFTRPDSASVYDNRGSKSTTAVVVRVYVPTLGWTVTANVYGRLKTTDGIQRVTFDASLPKGINAKDEHRDAWRLHVNTQLDAWSGRERAFREAYERLTEQPKPKTDKPGKVTAAPLEYIPPTKPAETAQDATAA